jgi:hypothetical protein
LGAVLALFPATAPAGLLLCLVMIVPSVVAFRRTRRVGGSVGHRALAAMVAAPVFLVVAAGTMPPAPATVPAGQALAAAPAPAAGSGRPALDALSVPAAATLPAAGPAPAPANVPATGPAPVAPALRAAAPKPAPVVRAAAPKAAPKAVTAPATKSSSCGAASYVNSSGNCVRRPVAAATAPSGASAKCTDGTYSFSQHRQGTCSGHRGVSQWLTL